MTVTSYLYGHLDSHVVDAMLCLFSTRIDVYRFKHIHCVSKKLTLFVYVITFSDVNPI